MEIMFDELKNIYKGKKVFITGHTGFKGTWLIQFLKSLDVQVCGYSLESETSPNHYSLIELSNEESIIGDILDSESLNEAIYNARPDLVFHLAAQALVRESYINPKNTYQTNVTGTLNLLEACRKCESVKAIVCITTDKVYENKEWAYPYRETDELGGYDLYSSSKACCELLISSYRNSFFNITGSNKCSILLASARAGNVIGGGDWSKDRLIPDIVKAASINKSVIIRNRQAVRPWQHVLDCLYGYLLLGSRLLNGEKAFATSWNFAPYSNETKTVEELASFAKSEWNAIDIEFGQPVENYHEAGLLKLDNSKTIQELKWTPVWNTEESIIKTIQWYKEYYTIGSIKTRDNISEYLNSLNKRNL
jgi:CDP-glucose 4,6-dehydratase